MSDIHVTFGQQSQHEVLEYISVTAMNRYLRLQKVLDMNVSNTHVKTVIFMQLSRKL